MNTPALSRIKERTPTKSFLAYQPQHVLNLDKSVLVHVQLLDDSLPDLVIWLMLDHSECFLQVLDRDTTLCVCRDHLERAADT